MREGSPLLWALLIVAAAGGGFLWWRAQKPAPVAPVATAPVPMAGRSGTKTVTPPPDAGPRHPLVRDEPGGDVEAPPAGAATDGADPYFERALTPLLGNKAVRSFLKIDQFAQRVTATIVNLATENAAVELWPVERTPGTFQVDATGDQTTIGTRNSDRYAAFVTLVDRTDARALVALYRRAYPILQRAYEELGYPGRYFNDQVVETIDHLLATPDIKGPIQVKRVTVNGGGTLYQFADPNLENRSSGQKVILRLGREHAVHVKAKLLEVRALIGSGATPR